jgi:hypothetical protein
MDRLYNLVVECNNSGTASIPIPMIAHADPDEAFLKHHARGTNKHRELIPPSKTLACIKKSSGS